MKRLYSKIKKRLKKLVSFVVPFNTHLRPDRVYLLESDNKIKDSSRDVIPHYIYPKLVTKLNISDDLYEACSAYWKPQRQVVTDYLVAEVPGGRIHTDNESSVAIISRCNDLIENVSLSLKHSKVTDSGFNPIFEQRYFTKPVKFKGTVFSMLSGGAGLNNVSHWFIDVLPRLHLLQKSGLYDEVDWFLVPSIQYSYQLETLHLLGIPKENIIAGDVYPHIIADKIIASTAPRGNHTLVPVWLCEYIRETILPLAQDNAADVEPTPKIYISRSDSQNRCVTNEAELIAELEPFGFKPVVLSNFSTIQKIKLFSNAESVISATGAGLVNLLFCRPGTKVIEIFNEGFVVEPFYDIAARADLDYDYIICKGRKVRNATQGQREDLTVDIARVVEMLKNGKKDLKIRQMV